MDSNQLVIFGGAYSNGNLVDNDLYLLKVQNRDLVGRWIKVPIKGNKPNARYGHTLNFIKPYIVLFGGTGGQDPLNDIWILNVEQSPFQWTQVAFNPQSPLPEARVYHSSAVWRSQSQGEFVMIYGGRNKQQKPLNDLWALGKLPNDTWEWVQIQGQEDYEPVPRYQGQMVSFSNSIILVGGRNNNNLNNQNISIEIFNMISKKWYSFEMLNLYRHVCWLGREYLYYHGGFEHSKSTWPTNNLGVIDLKELLEEQTDLITQVREYARLNENQQFVLAENVTLGIFKDNQIFTKVIQTDDLSCEGQKLKNQNKFTAAIRIEITMANTIINMLLNNQQQGQFGQLANI